MSFGLGSLLLIVIAAAFFYGAFQAKNNEKWSAKRRMFAFWFNLFAFVFVLIRLVWVTFFEITHSGEVCL